VHPKEIPEEIKEKERVVLITRKKLEQMIEQKTKELQKRLMNWRNFTD